MARAQQLLKDLKAKAQSDPEARKQLESLAAQYNYSPTGFCKANSLDDKVEFLSIAVELEPRKLIEALDPTEVQARENKQRRKIIRPVVSSEKLKEKENLPQETNQPTKQNGERESQLSESQTEPTPPLPLQKETAQPQEEIRYCSKCKKQIPWERIQTLPETKTCVKCSEAHAPRAFMVYDHKTAPRLILIDPQNKEAIRQAERANRRAR